MKRTCRILALVCVLFLLAACSKPALTRKVENQTPTDGITSIRIGMGANDVAARYLDLVVAEFQAKYPQYRVEMVEFERQALREKMSKGEVDLISTYGTADLTGAADLTAYIQRSGLDRSRFGYLLEERTAAAALPYAVIPYAIFVNQALFEEAGVPLPSPEWTWEEFRTLAGRLTLRDGERSRYGFAAGFAEELAAVWLQGKLKGPLSRADERSVQELLQFFQSLTATDRSMKPVAPFVRNGSNTRESGSDFHQGRVPMAHLPLFSATSLQQFDFPWTYLPLPVHPGGERVANSHSLWLALSESGPNKNGAWEFLQFAVTEPGAVALARGGFMPAAWSDATADAWTQGNPQAPEASRFLLQTRWSTGQYPDGLSRGLGWAVNQVLSGKLTAEEGVAEFAGR